MKTIAAHIEQSIQQDPGGRGIDKWAIQKELLPANPSAARHKLSGKNSGCP